MAYFRCGGGSVSDFLNSGNYYARYGSHATPLNNTTIGDATSEVTLDNFQECNVFINCSEYNTLSITMPNYSNGCHVVGFKDGNKTSLTDPTT